MTEPLDVHADFVINELKKRDVPVFRFHAQDFPAEAQISISGAGTQWSAEIRTPLRSLHLETALYALIGARWLSHPESMRAAADKVRQMRAAAAAGLAVPDTLIGNDVERVTEFHRGNVRSGRDTAVKSLWLRTEVSYDGGLWVPMTKKWPENVDPELVDAIRLTPAVFQEYVPKQRKIRAVVIGGLVFAASVDSQAIPAARDDVRGAGKRAGWEACDLPADVGRALLEMVCGLGLRFCSADLVLTPDGRYVFLDLNPNGQWLWLELEAGLPLSAAMADLLAAGIPEPPAKTR